jgi:phage/conjugal plasmid C-4 type zinc finger TraR family protein
VTDDVDQAQRFETMRRQIGLRGVLSDAQRQSAPREAFVCVDCGDPIEAQRRAACRGAVRCLDCQERAEAHRRLFPRGAR